MSAHGVEEYLEGLSGDTRATVDALRDLVRSSHPELVERIKWNAPSFALGDDDRITLGIAPKGGVRVVLHRGVARKDVANFQFDDPDKLAAWPAPDRGVLFFADAGAVKAREQSVQSLFSRWLATG